MVDWINNFRSNKSFFNITEEIKKIQALYRPCDEFSFTEINDELEEILGFSDFTPKHQHMKH